MSAALKEIARREVKARDAIGTAFHTEGSEVALFAAHHLEEVALEYWRRHLSAEVPDPSTIVGILEFQSHWGGQDEIDVFDFTLPEEVTNYVICARFGENGEVFEVVMES